MRKSGAPSFLKSRQSGGDTNGNDYTRGDSSSLPGGLGRLAVQPSNTDNGDAGAGVRSASQILSLLQEPVPPPRSAASAGSVKSPRVNTDKFTEQPTIAATPSGACESSSPHKMTFEAVYRKMTSKKHKTWEGDGTVEVEGRCAILKDDGGKELGRASKVKPDVVFEEGTQLLIGGKEVELGCLVSKVPAVTSEVLRPATPPAVDVPAQPSAKRARFLVRPRVSQAEDYVLPAPSASHQWEFNKEGHPVNRVAVEGFLARALRPHQREGVRFLYESVMGMRGPKPGQYWGALLADEMGLGKTLQCIALVWTLLNQRPYGRGAEIRRALVVTPSSLVDNWERDIYAWLGYRRLAVYKVNAKNSMADYSRRLSKIAIVSYERLVLHCREGAQVDWDLVICDEAHLLKNPNTEKAKAVRSLTCRRKVLLTGSPCQNNLMEFFEILDLANPDCLGTKEDFNVTYATPIVHGNEPACCEVTRLQGERSMQQLQTLTSLFMLRRTCEILKPYLPNKQDLVLMCLPAPLQERVYESAVGYVTGTADFADYLGHSSGVSPLHYITSLRQISSHPALLKTSTTTADEPLDEGLRRQLSSILAGQSCDISVVEHSGKLQVVSGILQTLHHKNERKMANRSTLALRDRALIVSYSTQTLNMLESLCQVKKYTYSRLDGNTPQSQRLALVNKFNDVTSETFVFLLSAKAGGTGLNLTGASRLILFDLDWNPANDAQALGRVWRGNQARPVITYRLLTTGTIEEKIFQRQIKKTGLNPTKTGSKQSTRLSSEELKDLLSYHPATHGGENLTHQMLGCDCACQGTNLDTCEETENHPAGRFLDPEAQAGETIPGISELLRWQHLAPDFDPALMHDLELLYAYDKISFMFRNVIDTPATK